MFSKILIANRGEIAVRIIRACREMGISTVAVYSSADADSLHTSLADESYCVGGASVRESYLNMNAILTVARISGAEAIHPGYGLLSENAEFAKACEENGITFIGPSSEVISHMGDKDEARKTMKYAGIPVIEGSEIVTDVSEARKIADSIGYPILIKARSGGGGRGIRLVTQQSEVENAFLSSTSEAAAAFGDNAVYIEKYLSPVKHIEVQLLCDAYGKAVVLGDRDCSMQRKNQKLLEECPAPTLPDEVRLQIHEAAKRAALAVGYCTVGTVEFLVDQNNHFYFMEMNTRLQVEHSVTEIVCGIDIVKWQIRTAAGVPVGFDESDVNFNGHAIECRICAEDPTTFIPSSGTIACLHIPGGPGVRFDTFVYQGYTVPPFYDSMLGKMIVYAKTREEAIRKMKSALSELILDGPVMNRDLYMKLLSDKDFVNGRYTTSFMKEKGYLK
jgi:acetyl-CoA carboxylase biotin carboxylase subunit